MIPKIIHYCWLSEEPYPEDILLCMNSWRNQLPDYEFILWNTSNFDVAICDYTKEAFREKKYAFVSDYIRLYALYHYGGIYLDSDVEVYKPFDDLLNNKAFTCFEDECHVAAWILGSEKGNPLFKEFMDYYLGRKFILDSGIYDTTTNPITITNILNKYGLKPENKKQELENITVYPMTYFCPFSPYRKTQECFSEVTYANHHFNGSWLKVKNEYQLNYEKKIAKYRKLFGDKIGIRLYQHTRIISNIGLKKWWSTYVLK